MVPELNIKSAISPALVRRGVVNVIGLDAMRTEAGTRWERTREAVYQRIETLLAHKLGPTDFFVRVADTSYLVVMPMADAADARLCCLRIAYELHRSLLGTCTIEDLNIARVRGENADGLEMKELDSDDLVELAIRGGIDELSGGLDPDPAAEPCRGRPQPKRATPWRVSYAPIWDAPREAVSAYRLEYDPPLLPQMDMPATREAVSEGLKELLFGIAQATQQLALLLEEGGRLLLVLPLPYDILGAPVGRMEISSAIKSLDSALRPFLVFSITGIPNGVPQSRMSDLVCAVRPFCRAVMIEFPSGGIEHVTCLTSGQQGVGITVAVRQGAEDDIAKLAEAGSKAGLTTFVSGIATLSLADAARDAGIQYLSGPLFGKSVPVPVPMWRLSWKSVLAGNPETVLRHG